MTKKLLPTQADRDAAADWIASTGNIAHNLYRRGKHDTEALVQILANHRMAAEANVVAWLRAESARIQVLMSDEIGMTDMRIGVQLKVDKLADAIERGDRYAQ